MKTAGRIANGQSQAKLGKEEHTLSQVKPGLWHHDSGPVTFALILDDFGVKHIGKESAEHLRDSLKKMCETTEDLEFFFYGNLLGMGSQDLTRGPVNARMQGKREFVLKDLVTLEKYTMSDITRFGMGKDFEIQEIR